MMSAQANAARSWKRLGQLDLEDGADSLSVTPSGIIVTGGMYNGLLISRDGGRAWRRVPSVDNTEVVGGGRVVLAKMINDLRGIVIVSTARAWITRDGGQTWLPVRIRDVKVRMKGKVNAVKPAGGQRKFL